MIAFGTESAQKQLERDKLAANREKVDQAIELIFSLDITPEERLELAEGYAGAYVAESLLEVLEDQNWLFIKSFMDEVFKWIHDNHHTHLIPAKYTDAYSLIQQFKQALQE